MSTMETAPAKMPPVKNGLLPYLTVDGALKAAEFYKKAFGAEEAYVVPADEKGRTMHIHLHVNGTSVMLSDFYPEYGHGKVDPQGFTLVLNVTDIESAFRRAVEAGAEVTQPVSKMFWGDLYGALRDPFGVSWAMNQSQR